MMRIAWAVCRLYVHMACPGVKVFPIPTRYKGRLNSWWRQLFKVDDQRNVSP